MFQKNVGTIDRIFRIAAGVGLIGYALVSGAWWGWLGIVPLMTGLSRRCHAYTLFGMDTCCAKKA